MTTKTRFFRGSDTDQVCGITGEKAEPESWYYEPADYEGDVLWSFPYPSEAAARFAAEYLAVLDV